MEKVWISENYMLKELNAFLTFINIFMKICFVLGVEKSLYVRSDFFLLSIITRRAGSATRSTITAIISAAEVTIPK